MRVPRMAIISFPGSNGEVESMRVIRKVGMEPIFFRWNDDRAKLRDVDGYFIPGGFSYEDRGRSGMIAAHDPLMQFIGSEADAGKVVIGICNGAQVLVESGLIPNGEGLQMSIARNAINTEEGIRELPFLSEWIWIARRCAKGRCATSGWDGVMQVPIAHGEGRFTTRDSELLKELKRNDQIAFSYCDADGDVSDDPAITPNGSLLAIAGICNSAGNVVALMPHPERAQGGGDAYFESAKMWMEGAQKTSMEQRKQKNVVAQGYVQLNVRAPKNVDIFIESIITNNEERTMEQVARKVAPDVRLKQWKYLSVGEASVQNVLSDLAVFNSNKERAFLRRGKRFSRWNAQKKTEDTSSSFFAGTLLMRRDIPDTGAVVLGEKAESGIVYGIEGISEQELCSSKLHEIFANPHASTLERLVF